jgi:integrase
VSVPKKNPPRLRWEPLKTCQAIVDAQEEPYRTLSALIHATGAELTPALRMIRSDIDLERMVAHIPGTKTASRNRHDVVSEQRARPYLERHCSNLFPTMPLFPKITRYQAYWFHKQACGAVGVEDYTVHDARRSLAVRWRKKGISLEAIAEQLGHKGILQVATVYGRFTPTIEEWQEEAAR